MIFAEKLQWLKELINKGNMIPFYKCKEWRQLRLEALKCDNYECQVCKRKGKYSSAKNVPHIKEVKDYPELALTLENLKCVCVPCHNEIHDKRLKKDKRKPFINEERW